MRRTAGERAALALAAGAVLDEQFRRCDCPACMRLCADDDPAVVARAEALLCEHLTPEQCADWERTESCTVTGSLGGRYRLYANDRMCTTRQADGRVGYCLVSSRPMPGADHVLARLLLLVTDEAAFLDRARVLFDRGIGW